MVVDKTKKKRKVAKKPPGVGLRAAAAADEDRMEEDDQDEQMQGAENETDVDNSKQKTKKVYVPGVSRPLKAGEEWECDETAYKYFHQFQCDFACLSFDPIIDNDGLQRETYPLTCQLTCGTQADKLRNNGIYMMKLSNIHSDLIDDEKEEEDEEVADDDDIDNEESKLKAKEPLLLTAKIPHHGGINRIRNCKLSATSTICAVWNDQGKAQIWNLTEPLLELAKLNAVTPNITLKMEKPLHTFAGHQIEGYAMDWSPLTAGQLATGDQRGRIHVWSMHEGGTWVVDHCPLSAHTDAVEDIQWSHSESNVFASCGSDHSIRLWDIRLPTSTANVLTIDNAHMSDVNVLAWNPNDHSLLVTGGDDAAIKVWDLKHVQQKRAAATFKHHTQPITSVQWHAQDSTVFAASGEDDQTTIWDLALETDTQESEEEEEKVPPQLLFVHMGQQQVKEVRWHPNLAGSLITTSLSGFDIIRTISV